MARAPLSLGWRQTSYVKLHFDEHKAFTSLYFLEAGRSVAQVRQAMREVATVIVQARRALNEDRMPSLHDLDQVVRVLRSYLK